MPHELPNLPYDKAALEPHIDALTMEIHHGRHHKAYVDNLNKAIAGNSALEAKSLEQIIKDLASVPDAIRGPVRNNGGGHWNHSFFWKLMAPNAGGAPTGKLADDIKANAMLVFTKRGHMARFASWMRPRHSAVYAFTDRWPTADGLTLLRGVIPRVVAFNSQDPDRTVDAAVTQLMNDGLLRRGDTVVVITNMASGERIVDGVKIRTLD
jgi:hypothetical protein